MAKKKTAKNGKSKKGTKKAAAPRPKGPRSVPLPGMEQVRHVALDILCEEYVEYETQINALHLRIAEIKSEALQEMQQEKVKVYKHGGAAFSRIPGADKLNARLTKDHGDPAGSGGGEATDAGAGEGE